MKKIALSFAALATTVAVLPMFAAFEAHIINVTARIENALRVPTEHLDFGTVFPQEHLDKPLDIWLSQSFLDEDRVDDVEYIIRQKPKCGVTTDNGTVLVGPTATGHVIPAPDTVLGYRVDCGEDPRQVDANGSPLPDGSAWGQLPLLCPYISKHPDGVDDDGDVSDNDGTLDSFHTPFEIDSEGNVVWTDVRGRLAKSDNDEHDRWTIDLTVPCFGDHCAQDWHDFVTTINPQVTDPDEFIQPLENEHKVFGCDLWVEVNGISLPPGIGCSDKADVMIVMDRSGSISDAELTTMQTAAKAFVEALAPSADGIHVGLVSFSTSATLDVHLTDATSTVNAAIDALVATGNTNLADGIDTADTELDNPGDGHDRADGDSPDFVVIITDGAPNEGGGEAGAKTAADALKLDGATIFAVGVGTSADTAEFLRDDIVTPPPADHYFDAADFDELESKLEGIAVCKGDVI